MNYMKVTSVGVLNNMTEIRVVNSKDIVMSNEEGNWKNNDEYEISIG